MPVRKTPNIRSLPASASTLEHSLMDEWKNRAT